MPEYIRTIKVEEQGITPYKWKSPFLAKGDKTAITITNEFIDNLNSLHNKKYPTTYALISINKVIWK